MSIRSRASGASSLVPLLAATLGLGLWLGVEALRAVQSHRRSAEAVLRDFASMATREYVRIAEEQLDDWLDAVFEDAFRRGREGRDPRVVRREIDDALADQRCACPRLRRPAAVFHVDLRSGDVHTDARSLSADRLAGLPAFLPDTAARVRERTGLRIVRGLLPGGPAALAWIVARDTERRPVEALGMVLDADALSDLFGEWRSSRSLLPPTITGSAPADSILHVAVSAPGDIMLYESTRSFPRTFSAADTLDPALGGLLVEVSVRPDAAGLLVIGGLPGSELPFLLFLLALTSGLGVATLFQIRRERQLARLRENFISGVSHELRTPLAQIRVFADLEESGKLRTAEERRRAIRVIRREALRLTGLVENVLRYSRGRDVATPAVLREDVDTSMLVHEVVEGMQPLADPLRTRIEVDAEDGVRTRAARDGLQQILVNLIDNALKYGPRGQTIRVRVRRNDGCIRIEVIDQGPGVPQRERETVFEPYRRLQRHVQARYPGTGIGLAVVRDLVTLYAGRVSVDDAPGGGARFIVSLPAGAVTSGRPTDAQPGVPA